MISLDYLGLLLFQTFSLAMVYALQALGVSVVFSIMKLINFAHGEMYAIGGYATYFLGEALGLPTPVAICGAIAVAGLAGLLLNESFIKQYYSGKVRGEEYVIAATFGVSLLLQNSFSFVFGLYPRSSSGILNYRIHLIGSVYTNGSRLVAMIVCGIVLLLTLVLIYRTRVGMAIRAVSQNSEAAIVCGIDSNKVYASTFILSTVLAGVAGAFVVPFLFITPSGGSSAILIAFVIVVLGGLGSIVGAVVGSFILATTQQVAVGFIADIQIATAYQTVWGLLILIVVLIVRPQGLFGEKVRLT